MTADDARRYATLWGCEPHAAIELTGGYSNASFRVATRDRGDVIVRRYGRLHVSRNAVAYEHAVMRYVAERSPIVRSPFEDPNGATMRSIDGALVAVLPYVRGTTGERDADAASSSATMLASFHRATIGFRAAHPRVTRTLATLRWLRERFVRLAADPMLAGALDWDVAIDAVAGAMARIAPLAARLPIGVVHADAHPDNVVRADGRACALIDFDFVHETERAYDVATAADAYARADEDAPLERERFVAYARAYDAVAKLSLAEWDALYDVAIRRAAMLVWYVVTRHGARTHGDVGASARYVNRLRELAAIARERVALRA